MEEGLRVLAIGPHSDDIELGCGATLLWLAKKRRAEIFYRLLSSDYLLRMTEPTTRYSREDEARKSADMLGVKNVYTHTPNGYKYFDSQNFPDTQFPEYRDRIHRYLEITKEEIDPHLIFAPSLNDAHQDHVTVADTVLRVFREGQIILHYEIRQFSSKLFIPNLFVDVSEELVWQDNTCMSFAQRKNHILQECFISQKGKMYLDDEVIMGTMRGRGQQCGRTVRYAEAFEARVSIFDFLGY